jgi:transcriptional regulator with XRE-family HTH domain
MSRLQSEEINMIIDLRGSGMSIREVASHANVPKSTVERVLKANKHQVAVPDVAGLPAINRDLDVTLFNNTIRSKELELEAYRAKERSEQIEARKIVLCKKYNRFLNEFLDNCQKATWSKDEVDDFIERCDGLNEKIVLFCDANNLDEEELAIWNHLDALIIFMEVQLDKMTNAFFGKPTVELDLSDKDHARIESFIVEDFDQLYFEDMELLDDENDEDEDDEDKDDEDEDEDEE